MSWYRQVKTLFVISITLFFFIVYAILGNYLFHNTTDYRLYLISLFTVFFMQYLIAREINRNICIAGSAALVAAALALKGGRGFLFDFAYCLFIIFLSLKLEERELKYEAFRDMAKQAAGFIIALGIVLPFVDKSLSGSIARFYPIFLIAVILGLRESRAYSYKVKNKNSLRTNILLIGGIILLSLDQVFQLVVKALEYLYDGFLFVSDKLFNLLSIVLNKPMAFLVNLFLKLSKGKEMRELNSRPGTPPEELVKKAASDFPLWLTNSLKVLILLLVLLFVYKLINKFAGGGPKAALEESEERQKIFREKRQHKSSFRNTFKGLFKGKSIREQILAVFKGFQEKTLEKGIFKRHMTATQLVNVTRAYIEDGRELNSIKEIYNEAKFSDHEVEEEKVKAIKEGYSKVKRQL